MNLENIQTVGYQYLIDIDKKEDIKRSGLILSDANSNNVSSGVVLKIGKMALEENPNIQIGDRLYFNENNLSRLYINGMTLGCIQSNCIKVVEKLTNK